MTNPESELEPPSQLLSRMAVKVRQMADGVPPSPPGKGVADAWEPLSVDSWGYISDAIDTCARNLEHPPEALDKAGELVFDLAETGGVKEDCEPIAALLDEAAATFS